MGYGAALSDANPQKPIAYRGIKLLNKWAVFNRSRGQWMTTELRRQLQGSGGDAEGLAARADFLPQQSFC